MVDLKITKYLSSNDVACPCCGEMKYDQDFVDKLHKLRIYVNKTFYYQSFYQCEQKNSSTFGSFDNSLHRQGRAAHIYVANWIGSEKLRFVKKALNLGLTIIAFPNYFHLDNREGQIFLVGSK
jgi:hypothetical protein